MAEENDTRVDVPASRPCDFCGRTYKVHARNYRRGWGRTCSKSCASYLRERARPDYDPVTVALNNERRNNWNNRNFQTDNYDPADSEYWDSKDYGD